MSPVSCVDSAKIEYVQHLDTEVKNVEMERLMNASTEMGNFSIYFPHSLVSSN